MGENFKIGNVTPAIPLAGKIYIFKLQDRKEKDEELTLESPGVRQRIADNLVNSRKQLLSASYAAIAMNDAKVENYLAKKVVDFPNELSGARPASANDAENSNSNANANSASNSNTNSGANSNAAVNTDKKADDKSKSNSNADAKSDKKKEDDKK